MMSTDERRVIARAALLNSDSGAFELTHRMKVAFLLADMPAERVAQLWADYPQQCQDIVDAAPTAEDLIDLDLLAARLHTFKTLPSEDRNHVSCAFMMLHDARQAILAGDFMAAYHLVSDAAYKLHWVACERKRNNVRSRHRMPDPDLLVELDGVSKVVDAFSGRLQRSLKAVSA
jgi:hypothetical protein